MRSHDIPLLLLHDFDKSGFSIAGTLKRSTRRYTFARQFKVHDLGLRLEDVEGLETEEVTHNASDNKVAANLRKNGATLEEIDFLMSQRVELNAFASDELVTFIERKLDAPQDRQGDSGRGDPARRLPASSRHAARQRPARGHCREGNRGCECEADSARTSPNRSDEYSTRIAPSPGMLSLLGSKKNSDDEP